MTEVKKGDRVSWTWGKGAGHGTVEKVSPKRTTLKTGGKEIVRDGTPEEPAVVIDSDRGNDVIKSASEVRKEKRGRR
jgi:plastocyanin